MLCRYKACQDELYANNATEDTCSVTAAEAGGKWVRKIASFGKSLIPMTKINPCPNMIILTK